MPAQLRPPIRLPGATWTKLMQDKANAYADRIQQRAEELFPDGVFPGTKPLQGRQKLTQYLTVTVDLSDLELIADPNYEMKLRAGLEIRTPLSPYWQRTLSIPGEFTKQAAEYVDLMERYAGGEPEPSPQTPAPQTQEYVP